MLLHLLFRRLFKRSSFDVLSFRVGEILLCLEDELLRCFFLPRPCRLLLLSLVCHNRDHGFCGRNLLLEGSLLWGGADVLLELVELDVVNGKVFIEILRDLLLNHHQARIQFRLLFLDQGTASEGRAVEVGLVAEERLRLPL